MPRQAAKSVHEGAAGHCAARNHYWESKDRLGTGSAVSVERYLQAIDAEETGSLSHVR